MADYTPIPKGGPVTANTITDRFTDVQDEINSLDEIMIEPRSLDHQHFESQIIYSGNKSISGFPNHAIQGTSQIHYYANMDPSGQGLNEPYTSGTSKIDMGWTSIKEGGQWSTLMGGSAQTGQELQINFPTSYIVGDTLNGVAGILVMANIEVVKLGPSYLVDTSTHGSPAVQHGTDHLARFVLQARMDQGNGPTWRNIHGSHRFLECDTLVQQNGISGSGATAIIDKNCDVAIRAMVHDMGGTAQIDAVRVLVAVRRAHSGGNQALQPTCVGLRHCDLTSIVFHGHFRGSW
tara:strand:- start:3641 stop:4516 length:876 start_codon:yes stop_codon:yes gene_type:complete